MALAANKINENVAVRDAATAVLKGFQQITQNASQFTAAEIAVLQTEVTKLKTALTAAGTA